jgi:hypothetical protein
MTTHNILYIEKYLPNHSGEAHIGRVSYSKTKQTIYYKSLVLQKKKVKGLGNYQDINSGESYWISGIKKIGTNRHWGSKENQKVIVDKDAKEEFLEIMGDKLLKFYEIEQ